ncbi:MAG TPA: 2-hydroxychromene-2-carboxylate isomerase [Caulobacteraceae bacterium]|nr:2-hydroxychromene-2-carboxylate isomerase [Caulobacteraceae bacterium]
MAAPKLEFWYEFASTYSYPAALLIEERAAQAGVEVVWRPFLLGPIFGEQGWTDSPFNIYPAKGRYMWRDLERICEAGAIPFVRPSAFPRNGLLAARVATAALDEGWTPTFSKLVYQANFARDEDISDREVLAPLILAAGGDPQAAFEMAASEAVKARLRGHVDLARQRGIFGAPSFVAEDGELFWGCDRINEALDWAIKHTTTRELA